MKKTILLVFVILLVLPMAFAGIEKDYLEACYDFSTESGGTTPEFTGQQPDAIVKGAVLNNIDGSVTGSYYAFNGSEKIDLGGGILNNSKKSDGTIAIWLKINASNGTNVGVMSRTNSDNDQGPTIYKSNKNQLRFLWLNNAKSDHTLLMETLTNFSQNNSIDLILYSWNATNSGDTGTLHINNTYNTSETDSSGTLLYLTNNLTLGRGRLDEWNLTGAIAHLAIWNISLTDAEKTEVWNDGAGVSCAEITSGTIINATNSYDNTTILSFTAVIFNDTYNKTIVTTNGIANFSNITYGTYTLNISSDDSGGYHNASYSITGGSNLEARLHQAVVYFTAVRRGANVSILDYNLSVPLAMNESNSTGGLRLLLNASDYQVSGISEDYFDILTNISLLNKSTSRWVVEFYDINVTISVYSVANNTFLHNFTIALTGTNFTETQTDVVGADEGNLTFSLGNGTYNMIISHEDYTSTPFALILLSNSTFQNLTFSIRGLNSINFSVYDEVTELLLPENATINLVSDDFYGNYTADDGVLYLQDIISGDYRITYDADKYTKRDYYVSIQNDSNHSIDLYLLSTTNGTEVTFTVQDNSGQDLENATIRLKRYYLSTNSYRTVAMSRTNTEGKAIIDVDFNDAFYETLTTYKDLSLRTIGSKMITTTMILTMNPITDPFTNIDAINDITTSLSFNNLTETFSYVFTDTTGASRTGTLTVIEITPTTETILCTTTDTSASATLICQANTTNATGAVAARGYIQVGSTNILTDTKSFATRIVRDFQDVWGNQGVFFTILVAGAVGGLGMVISPAVGIIMFVVSLVVVNFFGMTILTSVLYGSFVLIGLFIIWIMKR